MNWFLSDPFMPFSLALGFMVTLAALEAVLALLGVSIGDSEIGFADVDGLELDLEALEGAYDTVDFADLELDCVEGVDLDAVAQTSLMSVIGFGEAPFMIWLAAFLLGFGATGMLVQSLLISFWGQSGNLMLVGLVSLFVGLLSARSFARSFAGILPKTETAALSETSLSRRRGIISQGTAAFGKPAEVHVQDGFGNMHFLRAEPLQKDTEISQGTDVLVLRDHRTKTYKLVPLS